MQPKNGEKIRVKHNGDWVGATAGLPGAGGFPYKTDGGNFGFCPAVTGEWSANNLDGMFEGPGFGSAFADLFSTLGKKR